LAIRLRPVVASITLSLLLAACGAGSLPSQRSQDQAPPAEVQATAPESAPVEAPAAEAEDAPLETADAVQPDPEREPAAVSPSEEIALAELTEAVEAELERAPESATGAIKIGLLLPLSGPLAEEGAALLDAAQLALFDVADERFRLEPRDTGGTAEGALSAAEGLIAGGAKLLLGPLLSEEVRAVTPMARVSGINVVAFSTDTDVAGGGVYLLGHTSRQQIERLVAYAMTQDLRRFAVLAPSNPYGRSVAKQAREAVTTAGGEFARVAFYAPDASDAADVVRGLADYDRRHGALVAQRNALSQRDDEISNRALRRLEGLDTLGDVPFDALLLPDGGESLRLVAPLLPYYDIDPAKVRFLGTGLWDNPETLAEPTLVGGWYVGPPPEARAGFMARFEGAYGYRPHRIATLAYDATALAAALARGKGRTAFDAAALASPRGFFGAGGIFRFSDDGLPERGLAVLEIAGRGAVTIVSPPPERFAVTQAGAGE
jgi:branched-chain amino acid transport system substrate-binding protein